MKSPIGIAIAAIVCGAAPSQDVAAQPADDVLAEVIVTARKRAENLQDVPQSIDVLSARDLQNLDILQLDDFLTLAPSISFLSAGPDHQRVFIRGASDGSSPIFGSGNISTTGHLVDDLSFSFYGHIPDFYLYDMARIEILNGPQGTLFGPGSLSGAVRIITNKPDVSGVRAGLDVDGGQIDGGATNRSVAGFVNLPFADGATALRISAYRVHKGGYIDNQLATRRWQNGVTSTNSAWAGTDYNNDDLLGGRIAIQHRFSDAWRISLTAMDQQQTYHGSWEEDRGRYGALNVARFSPEGGYDYDRFIDLHVEGDAGIGDLIFASGYWERRQRRRYDYSDYSQYSGYASFVQALTCSHGGYDVQNVYTPPSGCNVPNMYTQFDLLVERWSNELRLQSKAPGPAHWTVGAYWEKTQDPYQNFFHLPGINYAGDQAAAAFSSTGTTPQQTQPLAEEYWSYNGVFDTLQVSEFGDLTVDIDRRFSVEAGVEHFQSRATELTNWDGNFFIPKTPVYRAASSHKTNFKAGVNLQAADRVLLYAAFAQGFREGSFNYVGAGAGSVIPREFGPDTLDSYELGWKSQSPGGRVLWNGALYYMPWKNYQVAVDWPTPPFGFRANVGDARIYGIESNLELRPAPGLQLSVSGSYNDSVLLTDSYRNPYFEVVPGERLPAAPALNLAAVMRYERPLASGRRTFAQLAVTHKGSMWNDLRIDQRILQPPYTLANVRVGLAQPDGSWQAEIYVSNLWNARAVLYSNYGFFSQPGHPDILAEPRVLGMRLSYRLGAAAGGGRRP